MSTWEGNYLAHHGIKGQKWGIRRFQNPDGSLTPEGIRRYGSLENFNRQTKNDRAATSNTSKQQLSPEEKRARTKKIIATVAGITLTAAAGYMAYKIGKQWTGNLRSELRKQAKDAHNDFTVKQITAKVAKNNELDTAKILNDRLNRFGGHYEGRYADQIHRHTAVLNARDMARAEGRMKRYSDFYKGISENATRTDAVKNYIKNHGKIVLPELRR